MFRKYFIRTEMEVSRKRGWLGFALKTAEKKYQNQNSEHTIRPDDYNLVFWLKSSKIERNVRVPGHRVHLRFANEFSSYFISSISSPERVESCALFFFQCTIDIDGRTKTLVLEHTPQMRI